MTSDILLLSLLINKKTERPTESTAPENTRAARIRARKADTLNRYLFPLSFCLRDWRSVTASALHLRHSADRASPELHPRTVLIPLGKPESVTPSAGRLGHFPGRFVCSIQLRDTPYHSPTALSTPGVQLYVSYGFSVPFLSFFGKYHSKSLQFGLFSCVRV